MVAASEIKSAYELTCPKCGTVTKDVMSNDACQLVFDCPACKAVLRPEPGDGCVRSSYGTKPGLPDLNGSGCCS